MVQNNHYQAGGSVHAGQLDTKGKTSLHVMNSKQGNKNLGRELDHYGED